MKRKKAPVANADMNTVEAATAPVAAETSTENSDADVLAALEAADAADASADDSPFSGPVETTEVVTTATEQVEVELEAEDEDAVLAALAAEEDDAPAATTTSKKKASTKPASAPVVTREFCDVADHMDDAALKTALDGINAKKVAEKATNVVQAITSGKKLSGFTSVAIKTLTSKGRVTAKDFIEAFQADGKTLGTARAQGQQMTALFKALGIANPDPSNPRELVVADNGLVKELTTLAA